MVNEENANYSPGTSRGPSIYRPGFCRDMLLTLIARGRRISRAGYGSVGGGTARNISMGLARRGEMGWDELVWGVGEGKSQTRGRGNGTETVGRGERPVSCFVIFLSFCRDLELQQLPSLPAASKHVHYNADPHRQLADLRLAFARSRPIARSIRQLDQAPTA